MYKPTKSCRKLLQKRLQQLAEWSTLSAAYTPKILDLSVSDSAILQDLPVLDIGGGTLIKNLEVDIPPAARTNRIPFVESILAWWLRSLVDQFGDRILAGRSRVSDHLCVFAIRPVDQTQVGLIDISAAIDGNICRIAVTYRALYSGVPKLDPFNFSELTNEGTVRRIELTFFDRMYNAYNSDYYQRFGTGCLFAVSKLSKWIFFLAMIGICVISYNIAAKRSIVVGNETLAKCALVLATLTLTLLYSSCVNAFWNWRRRSYDFSVVSEQTDAAIADWASRRLSPSLFYKNDFGSAANHCSFIDRCMSNLDATSQRVRAHQAGNL
jgi:hypothetical protein